MDTASSPLNDTERTDLLARIAALEQQIDVDCEANERGWNERDDQWRAREDEFANFIETEKQKHEAAVASLDLKVNDLQRQVDGQAARERRQQVTHEREIEQLRSSHTVTNGTSHTMSDERSAERDSLQQKLTEAQRSLESALTREKRERTLLEGRIRELISDRDRSADRSLLDEIISEKDRALHQQSLDIEDCRRKIASLEHTIAYNDMKYKSSVSAETQKLSERIAMLETTIDDLRDSNEELNKELSLQITVNDRQSTELASLQSKLTDTEQQLSKLKSHLREATSTLQRQYEESLLENDRLTETIEQYHSQASEMLVLQQSFEDLKAEYHSKVTECQSNSEALTNLQSIIESMQMEHSAALSALSDELTIAKRSLDKSVKFESLYSEANNRAESLASQLVDANTRLSLSESQLAKLQHDNAVLQQSFQSTIEKLKLSFLTDNQSIDRRLVVKLLLTFFEKNQSNEILSLMFRMLGFTAEEQVKVMSAKQGRSLGGKLKGLTAYLPSLSPFDSQSQSFQPSADDASLADLWVDFLLKETEGQNKSQTIPAVASATSAVAGNESTATDSSAPQQSTDSASIASTTSTG